MIYEGRNDRPGPVFASVNCRPRGDAYRRMLIESLAAIQYRTPETPDSFFKLLIHPMRLTYHRLRH